METTSSAHRTISGTRRRRVARWQ
uniref:Uncharacterized protein n=1 Tax=Arundo donax TaxID=35708 RepID=A0A0A9C341_ARUDO